MNYFVTISVPMIGNGDSVFSSIYISCNKCLGIEYNPSVEVIILNSDCLSCSYIDIDIYGICNLKCMC